MPIKLSMSEEMPQKRRVTRDLQTVIEQRWHPSCGKSPNVQLTTTKTVRESPQVSAPLINDSGVIGYTNSNFTKFNHCVHIEAKYGQNQQSARFLYQNTEVLLDDRPLNTGCGKYQYNYEHEFVSNTLKFDFAGYLNGSCLETLPSGGDDYLSSITGNTSLIAELAREATTEFLPKMDTGFSAPLFLAELVELKALWKNIARLWEIRMGLTPNSRDVADQYLGYQFGIAPLIDDIKKIVQKFKSANAAVLDFLENENKRMTLHFEKKLEPTAFQPSSWFEPTPIEVLLYHTNPSGDWYFARDIIPVGFTLHGEYRREVTDLEYHATMDFSYHLPDYSPAIKAFLASLDHWGVNFSISDVWEAIPFSFIVDWFFDVGSFLAQFDMTNLPVTVVVNDFCHSVKFKRKNEVFIEAVTPSTWTPLDTTLSIEKECYYRWPAMPPPPFGTAGSWQWPQLNTRWGLFRVSIGAALATGRLPYTAWFAGDWGHGDIHVTRVRRKR